MSENYITVAFPENIKLAIGFKNECLSLQKAINSINASELECCYHLFKLKAYNESISLMGCNSLEDFASKYFGFKGSTVRNYARIGSLCEVKKIGNKNKVVSCYADENGNDFTRSQLNELLSISDSKEVGFAEATPEQRANYNFKELLYAGCVTPKMSVKNLRRISQLLKKLGEKEIKLDTPEKVKAFLEIFATPVKVESLEFNAENMLALPDLSNVDNKTDDNKTDDNKTDDNKTDDNKTDDNKTDDNKTDDNKTDDNKTDGNKTDYSETIISESDFVARFYNDLLSFQKMHTKEETENLLAKIADIALNHEITE